MAGELQTGGLVAQIIGATIIVAAVIAAPFTAGASLALIPVGTAIMLGGTVLTIAGMFLTPLDALSRGDDRGRSPNYGFDQLDNPVERDAVIPVIYSPAGIPVAPPYAMAFTTPQGAGLDDDFTLEKSLRGQAMTALFPCAPHRLASFSDFRLDDQPIFDEVTLRELGTGNGTKRDFEIGKRVVRSTLTLVVGTEDVRVKVTRETTFTLRAGVYLYTIDVTGQDEWIAEAEPIVMEWAPIAGTGASWRRVDRVEDDPDGTFLRPIVWAETPTRLRIYTQGWEPAGANSVLRISYVVSAWASTWAGTKFSVSADNVLSVVFPSSKKPASGLKVKSSYWRRNIPGIDVSWRHGTEGDLPLDGLDATRNSYGNASPLEKDTPVDIETHSECDDVLLDIGSVADFRRFDDDGTTKDVTARVRVYFQRQKADGTWPASWTQVPNPANAGQSDLYTFALTENEGARVFWTLSLRGLLRRYGEKTGDRTLVNGFTRARFKARATRQNAVAQTTNLTWHDAVVLVSHTEVRDVFLAWPDFAKVMMQNVPAKRTGGRLPRVRVKTVGKPDVLRVVEGDDGLEWGGADVANQGNVVWASCDFFVEHYGGGRVYNREDNIDKASALAAATHAARMVSLTGGAEELASRLDVSVDTRSSLLDHLGSWGAPAGVVPFMRGDVLHFAIDDAVDLEAIDANPLLVIHDGTEAAGQAYDQSQGWQRPSLSTKSTEVEVTFFDEVRDWKRESAWSSPTRPTVERRTRRIEARGVVRRTQAQRYADDARTKAEHEGVDAGFSGTSILLCLEPGTVFRFISPRLGVDAYFRVVNIGTSSSFFVVLAGREYVPEAYGQTAPRRQLLENSATRTAESKPAEARASAVGGFKVAASLIP